MPVGFGAECRFSAVVVEGRESGEEGDLLAIELFDLGFEVADLLVEQLQHRLDTAL